MALFWVCVKRQLYMVGTLIRLRHCRPGNWDTVHQESGSKLYRKQAGTIRLLMVLEREETIFDCHLYVWYMQDPLADGPTIQAAHSKGLATGTNAEKASPLLHVKTDVLHDWPRNSELKRSKKWVRYRLQIKLKTSKSRHALCCSWLTNICCEFPVISAQCIEAVSFLLQCTTICHRYIHINCGITQKYYW